MPSQNALYNAVTNATLTVLSTQSNATSSDINFLKSRALTTIQNGDKIGQLTFDGYDGTNFIPAAQITATATSTITTNQVPGRLNFSTASSTGVLTQRMIIDKTGVVTIGAPDTGQLSTELIGGDLTLDAGNINMANTNSAATEGVYNMGGARFMHNFGGSTFLGNLAGNFTTAPGGVNVGIGSGALLAANNAATCVAVGSSALGAADNLFGNVAIGSQAMELVSGSQGCIGIGYRAQQSQSGMISSGNCIAIGNNAQQAGAGSLDNIAIGGLAQGLGYGSSENIAIGGSAQRSFNGTENSNIALGTNCQANLSGGSFNLSWGTNTNIVNNMSGSYNVIISPQDGGLSYSSTESSNILLNNDGVASESNVMRLGTTGSGNKQVNKTFVAGINGVTLASPVGFVNIDASGQLGVIASFDATGWSVITADQTAVINKGYFCNKAGTLALALPATSAVGDEIEVANINTATGIQFTQAAGQQIFIGNASTTSGATGTLTSIAVGDCLKMVCRTANTVWQVVSQTGSGWTPA